MYNIEHEDVFYSGNSSPSIHHIKKTSNNNNKNLLFTPTGNQKYLKIFNSRGEKHMKTMKCVPSFLHKFQSFSIEKKKENENNYEQCLTCVNNNNLKNKQISFTDFIKPIISTNNFYSYTNIQEKKYSKKKINEIFDKIKNYHFQFNNNKVSFPFPEKIGNKNGLKRIVFFDLEHILLYSEYDSFSDFEKIIKIRLPSGLYAKIGIEIRPYFNEMINMIKDNFFICIYTVCEQFYADYLINVLDDNNKIFLMKLYRDKCFKIKIDDDVIFFKDLRIIDNVELNDMIIIDSTALHFGLNIRNGIPILPFNKKNKLDEELLNLGILLNNIYKKKDMGEFIENTFKSYFDL